MASLKTMTLFAALKDAGVTSVNIRYEGQGDSGQVEDVEFDGTNFLLTAKQTNCLAQDKCGIPTEKLKVSLTDLNKPAATCTPGGGCC